MLIDWFTVGAQALNFVVLVWLMKRFLYRPVQDAIAAREKRIADQIADAAAGQTLAAAERKGLEDNQAAFDQQRAALLAKATADAASEAQRLIAEARNAAAALATQRQQALATQARQLQQLIAGRAVREVFAVARKTLADLATVSLEERVAEVFTRRLRELTGAAKQQLGTALKAAAEPAVLRSAFELPAEQHAAIRNAVNETFSADVPLRFETAADTVCGIELSAGGCKLAWSIDGYLGDFEHSVAALLAAAAMPAAAPASPDAAEPDAAPVPRTAAVAA